MKQRRITLAGSRDVVESSYRAPIRRATPGYENAMNRPTDAPDNRAAPDAEHSPAPQQGRVSGPGGLHTLGAMAAAITLMLLCQLLGEEGTFWLGRAVQFMNMPTGRLWVSIPGLGYLACIFGAFALLRANPRPSRSTQVCIALLTIAAIVLSNALFVHISTLMDCMRATDATRIIGGIVVVAFWCAIGTWILPALQEHFQVPIDLSAHRDTYLPLRATVPSTPMTLIALVSRIDTDAFRLDETGTRATLTIRHERYHLNFKSLDADIAALQGSRWPWQQLLRAIRPHVAGPGKGARPIHIILAGSRDQPDDDERGSFAQLQDYCVKFLERYPELRRATIAPLPTPIDFEDFNHVKDTIRDCIRRERARVDEQNIYVDITGGYKIASAAAAAATIGAHGRFQYVQTNGDHKVIVSDLHPGVVPTTG